MTTMLISDLLDELGIEFRELRTSYRMCCPIHGGDNPTGLSINKQYKTYRCFTHCCEEVFGRGMRGFIRGVLSHNKYGWEKPGDQEASEQEVNDILKGRNISEVVAQNHYKSFVGVVGILYPEPITAICSWSQFKKLCTEFPSRYFTKKRNPPFRPDTMVEYGVGDCWWTRSSMCGRAIVPIVFNNRIVACAGRKINDKQEGPKWKFTTHAPTSKILYNYDTAYTDMVLTGTCILVESPGNVWRLTEAGIYNTVACFGTRLHREQARLLVDAGIRRLLVLFDNDENGAGDIGAHYIESHYWSMFNEIHRIRVPEYYNDVAEMSVEEVNEYKHNWVCWEKAKR